MANNRLELDIVAKDSTAAGTASAKAQFNGVEQEAARAAAGMSKSFDQQAVQIVRSIDKAALQAARSLDALERRAALAGKSGVDKLMAQRGISIDRLGGDEAAIQRVTASYDKLAAAERRREQSRASTALRDKAIAASQAGLPGEAAFQAQLQKVQARDAEIRGLQNRATYTRARTPLARLALDEQRDITSLGTTPANIDKVRSAYADLRTELLRNDSAFDRFGQSAANAGMRLSIMAIPLALGAKRAIELSSSIEQAKIGFTTILGSKDAADTMVSRLQDLSVNTPFNFTTLVEQSRYLAASGFKGGEIVPALKAFGNAVAAGGGGDEALGRVLLQVGQIRSTGRATLKDLKPIAEAGVPVFDILAQSLKKPGQSEQSALEAVRLGLENGKFGAIPTLNLLQRELMIRYAGSLERQSLTIGGQISNLKDKSDLTFAALGNAMAPTTQKFISGASSILSWTKSMAEGFQSLPKLIQIPVVTLAGAGVAAGPSLFFLGSLAQLVKPAINGFNLLKNATFGLGGAFAFLSGVAGPLTASGVAMLFMAKGLVALSAGLATYLSVRYLLDKTGLRGVIDDITGPLAKKLGFTTERVPSGYSKDGKPIFKDGGVGLIGDIGGGAAVGDDKFFIEKYREGLKRRGLKKLPEQGALDNSQYLGVLRDLAGTYNTVDTDKKAERQKEIAAAEKRAHQLLIEAQKGEYTGLAKIIDQYAIYREEIGLSTKANRDLAEAAKIRIGVEAQKELKKNASDHIKTIEEDLQNTLRAGGSKFTKGLDYDSETLDIGIKTADERFAYEQTIAQQSRDRKLHEADAFDAQTLNQKLALESRKLEIEREFLQQSAILQIEQLDRVTQRTVAELEIRKNAGVITEQERVSRTDAVLDSAGQKAREIQGTWAQGTVGAQQSAANRQAQLIVENDRRVFESLKHSAEGLLDQLLSKTRNVGDIIKNTLKAAFLTPLKEAASNQIAAGLFRLVTGQKVGLEAATITGTGPIADMRRIFAKLGVGAQPVFGAKGTGGIADVKLVKSSVPVWIMNTGEQSQQTQQVQVTHSGAIGKIAAAGGALLGLGGLFGGKAGASAVSSTITSDAGKLLGGGTTIFGGQDASNPLIFHAAGGSGSPVGQLGGLAGLKGSAGGVLTQLGQIGATNKLFQNGVYGAKGGGLLLGGVALGVDGWRRGGLAGLGELTASGAMIGMKFGGPMGALIGGAIGLGIGTVRLFMKGAEEKAREKIRSAYGLDLKDKGILRHIIDIAKQSFGGNIDVAIRSPQVRELLELYAMSTGQSFGTQAKVRPVSLSQDSSGLYQNSIYENGRALQFSGAIGGKTSADIIPGNGGGPGYATNYGNSGPVNVNLTLNPQQTLDVFDGRTVSTVANNPRVVQTASATAQKGNYGRREAAIQQLSPGLLTA